MDPYSWTAHHHTAITHVDGASPPSVLWHTDTTGPHAALQQRHIHLLHTTGPMSNHNDSHAILGGLATPLIPLSHPGKCLSSLCFSQELLLCCPLGTRTMLHLPSWARALAFYLSRVLDKMVATTFQEGWDPQWSFPLTCHPCPAALSSGWEGSKHPDIQWQEKELRQPQTVQGLCLHSIKKLLIAKCCKGSSSLSPGPAPVVWRGAFSSAQREGESLTSLRCLFQHSARTLLEAMERRPWILEMVVVQSEVHPCSVCS